ncbi:hypothetical protein ASD15_09785 [Massilia sp. Root351]|jgi:hypothetical protein|uniref:hypothetical protein n=1 Tax=Massilia sp. Root351 TaxID=1736522 RepID=UPI00070AF2E9|nr:hypothetical protein [Massilia sp. Root351]KQV82324.1 hypothetical protein ASD15_09785 [Massilia sp. Root351]
MSRIESSNSFRVQGPVASIADLAKDKPGFVLPATPEQVAELQLREAQMQAREAAAVRHARDNPDRVYAQIVTNGEVVATVYASGAAGTVHKLGVKLTQDGYGLPLATTRLAELSKATGGEIVYAKGPVAAPAPLMESDLPQVTARGLNDMVQDFEWALARARMEGGAEGKA